jgi:hypothetical protein
MVAKQLDFVMSRGRLAANSLRPLEQKVSLLFVLLWCRALAIDMALFMNP